MRKANVFLVQVSKRGSVNVLKNGRYKNEHWQSKSRDRDHGKVRTGDLLLIYFAAKGSINFKGQLRRIYRVVSVSKGNLVFELKLEKDLNPLTYKQTRRYVAEKILSRDMKNCGRQGFNIKHISRRLQECFTNCCKVSSNF